MRRRETKEKKGSRRRGRRTGTGCLRKGRKKRNSGKNDKEDDGKEDKKVVATDEPEEEGEKGKWQDREEREEGEDKGTGREGSICGDMKAQLTLKTRGRRRRKEQLTGSK